MMGNYTLNLNIDSASLVTLKNAGAKLYLFRRSESSNLTGVPLIFDIIANYLENNVYTLYPEINAYISNSPISPNQKIRIGQQIPCQPGKTVNVSEYGTLNILSSAPSPEAVYFQNNTGNSWTAGVSATLFSDCSQFANFNALTLNNTQMPGIKPTNAIMLMWSSSTYSSGSSLAYALSNSILIDLDLAGGNGTVMYTSTGWSSQNSGIEYVPSGAPLGKILFCKPADNKPYL